MARVPVSQLLLRVVNIPMTDSDQEHRFSWETAVSCVVERYRDESLNQGVLLVLRAAEEQLPDENEHGQCCKTMVPSL